MAKPHDAAGPAEPTRDQLEIALELERQESTFQRDRFLKLRAKHDELRKYAAIAILASYVLGLAAGRMGGD